MLSPAPSRYMFSPCCYHSSRFSPLLFQLPCCQRDAAMRRLFCVFADTAFCCRFVAYSAMPPMPRRLFTPYMPTFCFHYFTPFSAPCRHTDAAAAELPPPMSADAMPLKIIDAIYAYAAACRHFKMLIFTLRRYAPLSAAAITILLCRYQLFMLQRLRIR